MNKHSFEDAGREAIVARSMVRDRNLGYRTRAFLQSRQHDDGLHRLLQCSLAQPFSLASFEALARVGDADFNLADFITLKFDNDRFAIIYNLFKGSRADDLHELRSFLQGERSLFGPIYAERAWQSSERVLTALEATVASTHSPIMTSIFAGATQVAMPAQIILGGSVYGEAMSAAKVVKNPADWSEGVRNQINDIYRLASAKNVTRFEAARSGLRATGERSKRPMIQLVCATVDRIYNRPKKSISLESANRYAHGAVRVLEMFHRGEPLLLSPAELQGHRELSRTLEGFPEQFPLRERFQKKKVKSKPESSSADVFQTPQHYEAAIGYDRIELWQADLATRTKRMLASPLMESGRRIKCAENLTCESFAMSPISGEIRLFIGDSKTDASSDQFLPISQFWPDKEILFVKDWIRDTHHLPRKTRLLTLAGIEIKPAWKDTRDNIYSSLYLEPNLARGVLSEPRTIWCDWFPIRVICARHPQLLSHPLMAEARLHRWFQPENLEKIAKLVQGETGDSVEIARRLLGHADWSMFLSTYCHCWPLLSALEAWL